MARRTPPARGPSVYRVLAQELDLHPEQRASFLARFERWVADELDVVEFTPFAAEWGWKPNLFLRPDRLQVSLAHHLKGEQLEAVMRANKRLDALVGRDRDRPRLRLSAFAAGNEGHDWPGRATFFS